MWLVLLETGFAITLVVAGTVLTDVIQPDDGHWTFRGILKSARRRWRRVLIVISLFLAAAWFDSTLASEEAAREEARERSLLKTFAALAPPNEPFAAVSLPALEGEWNVDVMTDGVLEQTADCKIRHVAGSRIFTLEGLDFPWTGTGELRPEGEGVSIRLNFDDGYDQGTAATSAPVDSGALSVFTLDYVDAPNSQDVTRGYLMFTRRNGA